MITLRKAKKTDSCDACNKESKANYTITAVRGICQIDITLCEDCIKQLKKLIDNKVK